MAMHADIADERGHGQSGEKTVDHGGDAGQDLQQGFGDGPEFRIGIFREIDRRDQADGDRHDHGDAGNEYGAGKDRNSAEGPNAHLIGADGHLRAPLQAKKKIANGNLLKKADGLKQHRQNDADGGEDGEGGTERQQTSTTRSTWVAGPQSRAESGPGPGRRRSARWPVPPLPAPRG